jgi:hypothetical protein
MKRRRWRIIGRKVSRVYRGRTVPAHGSEHLYDAIQWEARLRAASADRAARAVVCLGDPS